MIAILRNLDGFNYLDNSIYHVDGYGTHFYPDVNDMGESVTDKIGQNAKILGTDKPFWITKWGLDAKKYQNKRAQSRGDGLRDFCAVLDRMHLPLGPVFYYDYSPGSKALVDETGALLPEAGVLSGHHCRARENTPLTCFRCTHERHTCSCLCESSIVTCVRLAVGRNGYRASA